MNPRKGQAILAAHIARVIKRQRIHLGLSQEQLGDRAGLDRTYVSGIERGKRNMTLGTLSRIVKALSLTPADFLKEVLKELE